MIDAQWIELDGTVNTRDVGGLPTADGGALQPNRLLRSDNLQHLSDRDVRLLVDEVGVRAVADLRTSAEVDAEGPGPLTREPLVRIEHLSLVPEAGTNTDVAAADDSPVLLPWHRDDNGRRPAGHGGPPVQVYLNYLRHRGEAVVASLRLIASTDGATIVHCAAGKDRTGTVVAFALAEVGVDRDSIVADYLRSAERIEEIFAHLAMSPTYATDVADGDPRRHAPRAQTMQALLEAVDAEFGGVPAWLRANGWDDQDAAMLRAHLLG